MIIKEISFEGSHVSLSKCPATTLPEFAFIGRSNVGKSSLINMLTNRKNLARTSNKPGKTQTLNFFLIDKSWYMVDLPGYGYSKISKTQKAEWAVFMRDYLEKRATLYCVFLLIDSRIPVQKTDLDFIHWMGGKKVPFVVVFTKTDKLKPHEINEQTEKFKKEMLKEWQFLPQFFLSSSKSSLGKKEILDFINETKNKK